MKILSIDTAMNACSAAVYDDETAACAWKSELIGRGHAERLVPMLEDLLATSRCAWTDIGHIAVTVGPGAFTGLRVGLSTARTLSLVLDVPLAGISTLDAIARQCAEKQAVPEGHNLCVVIETKRSDFYYRLFDKDERALAPPLAAEKEDVLAATGEKTAFAGDGARRLCEESGAIAGKILNGFDNVDPCVLARMTSGEKEEGCQRGSVRPLYLRQADVSISQKRQRTMRSSRNIRVPDA